jgi:ADP-heptose:LPS heptosyltransferase
MTRTLFASVNLLGDTLVQTPALRAYKLEHPDEEIHWLVQDQPHTRAVCERMAEAGVVDYVHFEPDWDKIHRMEYSGYDKMVNMKIEDLWLNRRNGGHMSQAFGHYIGVYVPDHKILPIVPIPELDPSIEVRINTLVVSPLSFSKITSVDAGEAGVKSISWECWQALIDNFIESGRVDRCTVLMAPNDPDPPLRVDKVMRLPLDQALAFTKMSCEWAGAYAGVENGFTHAAAGLILPTFCVHPKAPDPGWASYHKFKHYRVAVTECSKNNVEQIWSCWKDRL